MKRTLLILLFLSLITNCADKKPESDKELKDTLRHYLKATLNDPKSYEYAIYMPKSKTIESFLPKATGDYFEGIYQ